MSDVSDCVNRVLALEELRILASNVVPYNEPAVERYMGLGCFKCNKDYAVKCVFYVVKDVQVN